MKCVISGHGEQNGRSEKAVMEDGGTKQIEAVFKARNERTIRDLVNCCDAVPFPGDSQFPAHH